MFITLEGIEGSGKSTLASALADALRSAGQRVVSVREPGGTPLGDAVRSLFLQNELQIEALSEVFLINASRRALVTDVIAPALNSGAVVICDRYVDSTRAYQGYGRGVSMASVDAVCNMATGGLEPAVTLLLDIDLAGSIARLERRGKMHDRMEREHAVFHTRVRDGFLSLAKQYPRIHTLDAHESVDALVERALTIIAGRR